MPLHRVPQVSIGVYPVHVSATDTIAAKHSCILEILQDLLHRPLRNVNLRRHVPDAGIRTPCETHENM
jgi:hypothetical protein